MLRIQKEDPLFELNGNSMKTDTATCSEFHNGGRPLYSKELKWEATIMFIIF